MKRDICSLNAKVKGTRTSPSWRSAKPAAEGQLPPPSRSGRGAITWEFVREGDVVRADR